jgi:hypothetical protein
VGSPNFEEEFLNEFNNHYLQGILFSFVQKTGIEQYAITPGAHGKLNGRNDPNGTWTVNGPIGNSKQMGRRYCTVEKLSNNQSYPALKYRTQ